MHYGSLTRSDSKYLRTPSQNLIPAVTSTTEGSFMTLSDARNQFCDGESASGAKDSNMAVVEAKLGAILNEGSKDACSFLQISNMSGYGLSTVNGCVYGKGNDENGASIDIAAYISIRIADSFINSLKESLSELQPCRGNKQGLSHEDNLDGNDFIVQISISIQEDTLGQLQKVSLCDAFCSEIHCQKTTDSLNVVGHKRKKLQLSNSGFQEFQMMKLSGTPCLSKHDAIYQGNDSHFHSTLLNSGGKFQVSSLTTTRKKIEILDSKAKSLNKYFCTCGKMGSHQSFADTTRSVPVYLEKRILRKCLFQNLQTFPNMDAFFAFMLVLNPHTSKSYAHKRFGARNIGQKLEFLYNLMFPGIADEQLDLLLSFVDLRSGRKKSPSLVAEIRTDAVKAVRVGYSRIMRLSRCITQEQLQDFRNEIISEILLSKSNKLVQNAIQGAIWTTIHRPSAAL
ncbi:hypothetical protein PIB30_071601 [Stylosanthes scabra]|uniref:Uncharacterized protein n=1 Tax=Stylosanthes scabra TaxID=79078 RepID=A0ABU6SQJ7_9FABA|nr:hypothetical protein [Stylosanthes scabra]